MSDMIDITMTATVRPDIIRRTLKSYCKNLLQERDRYRLIINIDPVGEDIKPEKVIKTCESFFKNIVFNIPKEPSFPKAVIWTWNQVESDFAFHLEDDWLLEKYIDINDMIRILNKYKEIACLRLSKYNIPNSKRIKLFNAVYKYNEDGFYLAFDSKKQFGLNPVLIKKSFIKQALPLMVDNKNPEKQFRFNNPKMSDFVLRWKYAIYSRPGWRALAIDNGVNWKYSNKFVKPNTGTFLVWQKKENL